MDDGDSIKTDANDQYKTDENGDYMSANDEKAKNGDGAPPA